MVEYKYDAWGKPLGKSGTLASTLGTLNPFRYRGYVYDEETGLYYLRSRYYNPEWGRFISADALLGKTGELFSHNLFCYCGNNPANNSDSNGNIFEGLLIKIREFFLGDGGSNHGGSFGNRSDFMNADNVNSNKSIIPQEAYDTYDYVIGHNGSPQKNYKGGTVFENDGRDGSFVLPDEYKPFYEYDIYEKIKGIDRGTERIVIGSGFDRPGWYTPDHYRSFIWLDR